MNLTEDSVVIVDLAEPHTTKITFIGQHRDMPTPRAENHLITRDLPHPTTRA